MLGLYQLHHLLVDLSLGLGRAGQGGVPSQVLVVHRFQGHHVKVLAHAVPGDHGPGQLGGLLDVVGGSGGNRVEHQLLGGTASGKGGDLVFQLRLVHQVVVALVHLHGVAQGTRGPGDDGDLLHRSRVGLLGCHQSVADLVVGHDALFLIRQDGVLFLVACNDHLDALLQVCLGHALAPGPYRPQSGLIDDVGQLGTGGTGSHAGHGVKVHPRGDLYLFGVDLQDLLPALQVRQLHRHPAVKAAGTGQSRVQGIRAVGGCQDDDPGVALKAVHFRQQLVQGLLPLVVASQIAAVALLANGVDLVDKHDAGGLFLGLLEQVPDLGGTHAHKHLHKLGAGDGKEGHVGLTCHGLGQHGLAGARRAYQQDAFGHRGTDFLILLGVVEVVDDLLQVLLGLVLSGHICKADAVGGLHIDLGVGFACAAKHHGSGAAACLFHELFVHLVADKAEQQDGQGKPDQKAQHRGALLHDLAGELGPGIVKPLGQARVVHQAGLVDLLFFFIGEHDLVGLDVHLADLFFCGHGHKGAIVHLFDLTFGEPGHKNKVEHQQHQQHDGVVDGQGLFGRFDFLHRVFPPSYRYLSVSASH